MIKLIPKTERSRCSFLATYLAIASVGVYLNSHSINVSCAQDFQLDLDIDFVIYSTIEGTVFEQSLGGRWEVIGASDMDADNFGDKWTFDGSKVMVDRKGTRVRNFEISAELNSPSHRVGLMNTTGRQYVFHHGALIRVYDYILISYSLRGGPLFMKESDDVCTLILTRAQ